MILYIGRQLMDNEDRLIERVEELETALREVERWSRYFEGDGKKQGDFCLRCSTEVPDHHRDCVFAVLDTSY